jgi:hypothetical protein
MDALLVKNATHLAQRGTVRQCAPPPQRAREVHGRQRLLSNRLKAQHQQVSASGEMYEQKAKNAVRLTSTIVSMDAACLSSISFSSCVNVCLWLICPWPRQQLGQVEAPGRGGSDLKLGMGSLHERLAGSQCVNDSLRGDHPAA